MSKDMAGPSGGPGVDGGRPESANTAYIKARARTPSKHSRLVREYVCGETVGPSRFLNDRVVIKRISYRSRSAFQERPSGYSSTQSPLINPSMYARPIAATRVGQPSLHASPRCRRCRCAISRPWRRACAFAPSPTSVLAMRASAVSCH